MHVGLEQDFLHHGEKKSATKKLVSATKTSVSATKTSVSDTKALIQDSILTGDLIKALEDAEMSPLRDARYIKDSIFHILNDDNLVLALTKACTKKKKKPDVLVKKAVKTYLTKNLDILLKEEPLCL